METHQNLEKHIKEETASLGELQKNQGAVENEIFRLAGDNTITDTLQKKKRSKPSLPMHSPNG